MNAEMEAGFGRDQDALGIQPVQDAIEALAFLADAIRRRDRQILDEQQVRGCAAGIAARKSG